MRYPLLDPLRGIAALWVFTFHHEFSTRFAETFPFLLELFDQGDLGVPMFFVISGFCITASAEKFLKKDKPVAGFVYRRLRRIYPTYWFSVIVVVALPFLIEGISSIKTGEMIWPNSSSGFYKFLDFSFIEWLSYLSLVQVFYPLDGVRFLQDKFTSLNAVYWTLAIEVQFYLVVAVVMFFRRKFYSNLLLITLISLPLMFFQVILVNGIFLPYWPMFALGVLVYWLFKKQITPATVFGEMFATRISLLLITLITLFLLITLWHRIEIEQFYFTVIFALFLWLAHPLRILESEATSTLMRLFRNLFIALGAMSYSLYLIHGKLQHFSHQLMRQIFPINSIAIDLGVIVLTCIFTYGFYYLCERPFARPIR